MRDGQDWSADTARAAAERDELRTWVADFLSSPGSDNAALAEELTTTSRWWIGPLRLPHDQLHRLAGPPDAPVLCPVDDDEWRDDVDDLARRIEGEGWEPPPVIVTYRNDQLVLEDGNHRIEGLRRAGRDHIWAVVGFETVEDRDRFEAPNAA